ncbi:MAG: DUF1684 domain-containing protein [Anaerolineae bacterium]
MPSNEQIVLRWRQSKDRAFKSDDQSPLSEAQQDAFTGLSYFDYNPALDLVVDITPIEPAELVQVMTTTNEIRNYRRYGEFTFTVEGESARLTIYETPHGFFLPFVDASSETYGAGRYIDVEPLSATEFHVDFNMAYNPFCVYSERFSCPLTPAENRLKVAIRAGEKIPGEWVNAQ